MGNQTRVSRDKLLEAVKVCGKFTSRKVPYLNQVWIEMDEVGNLRVKATDLSTYCVADIKNYFFAPDNAADAFVSAEKLAGVLHVQEKGKDVAVEFVPEQEVPDQCPQCSSTVISVEQEINPLTEQRNAVCGKCEHTAPETMFRKPPIPPMLRIGENHELKSSGTREDWPSLPEYPEDVKEIATLASEHLKKVVTAAAGDDDGLFTLHHVYVGNGEMVATDGHRLHKVANEYLVVDKPFLLNSEDLKKILPLTDLIEVTEENRRDLAELPEEFKGLKKAELLTAIGERYPYLEISEKDTVAGLQQKVREHLSKTVDQNMWLSFGNFKLSVRKIDAKFPDYKMILSGKKGSNVQVKNGLFQNALTKSLAINTKMESLVKLSFNGSIEVEAETSVGKYDKVSVPLTSGECDPPVTFGYNPRFLIGVTSLFGEKDDLTLTVPESTTALFIENGTFEAVVMPLRV